jgi:hypothetical protein
MRNPRARVTATALALGLSTALAVGAAAPATAATAAPAAVASSSASKPFPGKTAKQILALSAKAAKGASSVHIRAHFEGDDSKKEPDIDLDLVIGRTSARGTWRYEGEGAVTYLRVKSQLWLKGDAAYWKAVAEAIAADQSKDGKEAEVPDLRPLIGKWLVVSPKNSDYKPTIRDLVLTTWTKDITNLGAPVIRTPGKVIRKLPTVGVMGYDSILYVQAKGQPFPLQEISRANPKEGLTYFDWNKKVSFKAPEDPITEDQIPLVLSVP